MPTIVDDPQQLEFSGEGSEECGKFISAVIKHAFAQGKQREDAWIADFVATCLTEDALRWWIELDEETQGSWKLLRRAMAQEYQPLFQGGSGEEAEKFVRMVYRRAQDAGKQGDNRWFMGFVPTCLSGEALRWYASLDPSIRNDWDSFQQAILARYPRKGGSNTNTSPTSIVPTPAAAAPVAASPRQKGRIVVRLNTFTKYYVSKKLSHSGAFSVTQSLNDALEVELVDNSEELKELYLPQNLIPGFDVVGIVWYDSNFGNPTNFSAARPANSQARTWGKENSSPLKGPAFSKIWRLKPERPDSKERPLTAVFQNGDLFAQSGVGSTGNVLFYTTPRGNTLAGASLAFESL